MAAVRSGPWPRPGFVTKTAIRYYQERLELLLWAVSAWIAERLELSFHGDWIMETHHGRNPAAGSSIAHDRRHPDFNLIEMAFAKLKPPLRAPSAYTLSDLGQPSGTRSPVSKPEECQTTSPQQATMPTIQTERQQISSK